MMYLSQELDMIHLLTDQKHLPLSNLPNINKNQEQNQKRLYVQKILLKGQELVEQIRRNIRKREVIKKFRVTIPDKEIIRKLWNKHCIIQRSIWVLLIERGIQKVLENDYFKLSQERSWNFCYCNYYEGDFIKELKIEIVVIKELNHYFNQEYIVLLSTPTYFKIDLRYLKSCVKYQSYSF
ncbi:unnamed protein product [Paramecium sonneborni]|uniref:Uncharacterized protein n=1 Tax=Paramecium sonneborni TaxID=65129 RepID=A0A8S1MIQ1_9CILI|nr:unnamed protein product [Paramecium sonneborni]